MGFIGTSSFFARQDHRHDFNTASISASIASLSSSFSSSLYNISSSISSTIESSINNLSQSVSSSLFAISGTTAAALSNISSSISGTIYNISSSLIAALSTINTSTIIGVSASYTNAYFLNLTGTNLTSSTGKFLNLSASNLEFSNITPLNNYNREVWVIPYSASANANGSKFNAFNPVSAQSVGASGPIMQAAHYLMNIPNANAQQENSPKIIHVYQGRYDENIIISGSEPYEIIYNGGVRFGNIAGAGEQRQFTLTKITTPLTYSSIGSAIQFGILKENGLVYGSFNFGGPLILATTGSVTTTCYLENTTFDSISSSLCTGSVVLEQLRGNYRGRVNFTGTSAIFKEVDFSQALDISGSSPVRLFEKCVFRAPLTLSAGYTGLPAGLSRGFLNCEFKSGFTFSGPTGSAQFDLVTYRNFLTSSGVFIGGASTNDFLIPGLFNSGSFSNLTATYDIQVNGILLSASVATSISTLSSTAATALSTVSSSISSTIAAISSSAYLYSSQSLNSLSSSFSSTIYSLQQIIQIQVSDPNGSAITTGDGKAYLSIPYELNNYNLINAQAALFTGSTSGIPTFQIRKTSNNNNMLTTPITIDIGSNPAISYTAAIPPVIDITNDDVQTGELVAIDVDVSGTGVKGLMINLTFQPV